MSTSELTKEEVERIKERYTKRTLFGISLKSDSINFDTIDRLLTTLHAVWQDRDALQTDRRAWENFKTHTQSCAHCCESQLFEEDTG